MAQRPKLSDPAHGTHDCNHDTPPGSLQRMVRPRPTIATGQRRPRYRRPDVEGNRCAWRCPVDGVENGVENGFKDLKTPGRQTNAGTNGNSVIPLGSQLPPHRWPGAFIWVDE